MAVDVQAQTPPQPIDPKDQERLDKELIQEWESRYEEAKRTQTEQERMWKENVAFILGFQWLRSDQRNMLNVVGVVARGRQKLVASPVADQARRLHARLDQVKYMPSVQSDTDDPDDREAAKAADGAVRWFHRRKKIGQMKRRANWWIVACGLCYFLPYYDPMAGPLRPLPKLGPDGKPAMENDLDDQGLPIMDPVYNDDGTPAMEADGATPMLQPRMRPAMELRPIGDWDLAVYSPFAVKRDARFQDWEKLRWVILEETAAREEVADRFRAGRPDIDQKLPTDHKMKTMPWMPDVSGMTSDYTGIPKPPASVSGALTVKRGYERPSAKHPDGLEIIWVGGLLLHKGPLGTPDSDFPMVPVGYLEMPFVLEARSPLDGVKGIARAYNRIISRYLEHLIRLHIGWLLVPSTSGIPKGAFTNDIAPVIRYAPGGGPPQFIFPPLQGLAWYDKFLQLLEHIIEERMALPPAARGQMPKGAKAYRTLELLQESADQVQAPVLNQQAEAWIIVYEKVLMLMDRHAGVERMLTYIGQDKKPAVVSWKNGLMPREWHDRLTVHVEAGESLPSTGQGRREFVGGLVKQGMFGTPKDQDFAMKLREAYDLGPGFIRNDQDMDVAIAQVENLTLLEDPQLPVNKFDDDLVHLRELMNFAKRLVLAGRKDDAERLLPHMGLHNQQRLQKMQGMKGGPGAGSEPEKGPENK